MRRRRLLGALCCLFALGFVVSASMAVRTIVRAADERSAFDELAERVSSALYLPVPVAEQAEGAEAEPSASAETEPHREVIDGLVAACRTLQAEQPDFAAWLKIENAGVDLPVMATEDYIYRAFDGSGSSSGTPFIGEGGGLDSGVFIIYAHNMKNGTMFGSLDAYRGAQFRDENPVFSLTTTEERREYEVFAAVETRVLNEGENGLRWYWMSGDPDETERAELIDWLLAESLYDSGIRPEEGEQLLLPATCSYHTSNGRFVVAARRI